MCNEYILASKWSRAHWFYSLLVLQPKAGFIFSFTHQDFNIYSAMFQVNM